MLKVDLSIAVIEEGIEICSNAEHPAKQPNSISVTREGISICFNNEQLSKA